MRQAVVFGALFGALAIAIGAFGAHSLEKVLSAEDLGTFLTGARYQMYHALALIALGAIPFGKPRLKRIAMWCWVVGTIVFSGSLYVYVGTKVNTFAMVTPMGGLSLIAGWVFLLASVVRKD